MNAADSNATSKQILDGAAMLATAVAGYSVATKLFGEIISESKKILIESFKEMAELQSKALATNIKTSQLFSGDGLSDSKKELRSALTDVEVELLNFRQAGITTLDKNTVSLADRMIFTGQKVGTLATFLTNTAASLNVNSNQSSELAKSIHESTKAYGVQLDAVFNMIDSLKELNTNLVGLVGPEIGVDLAKMEADYLANFGTGLSDQIKSVLTFMLDPRNQPAMMGLGMMGDVQALYDNKVSAEKLQEILGRFVTSVERITGAGGGNIAGELPGRLAGLDSIGVSSKILADARALRSAALKTQMKGDPYEEGLLPKDLMTAIRNNFRRGAENMGEAFTSIGKELGLSYKTLHEKINPLFDSMFGYLNTIFKQGLSFAANTSLSNLDNERLEIRSRMDEILRRYNGSVVNARQWSGGDYRKLEIQYKEIEEKIIKQKELLDLIEKSKLIKLDEFKRSRLESLRPLDTQMSIEMGSAQLAALDRIEKNTYDQRRMTDMATRMSTMAMNLATNSIG